MGPYYFALRTLRMLSRHHPWKLILVFVMTMVIGVNSGFSIILLVPLLQLLDTGAATPANDIAMFFQNLSEKTGFTLGLESILIIYVIILTVNALLQYFKSVLDASYQQSFISEIRSRLFRKIVMADWHLLTGKSRTNHLQVLTKEVPNLAYYYYYLIRLLTTLVVAFCYVTYAMLVSSGFTLIIIAVGGVLFFVLRKFLFRAFRLGEGFVETYNRLLKYIEDFWQSVKIAKVHSSEEFYFNKFNEASTSLLDIEFRMQKNWSLPQLIYRIAGIVVLVGIVYLGYTSGRVPLTSFFILIILFSKIFPLITGMNTDLNMLLSTTASVKLVLEADDEFPEVKGKESRKREMIDPETGIILDNISFSFADKTKLFEGFTETIPAKKLTCITGESGIGKTTLIDVIAGLQKPDSGTVKVDGVILNEENISSWKSSIGYLPQDPFFLDGTLKENLVWDSERNITDDEILKVLKDVNCDHILSRMPDGIETRIVNYQFTFSGGECQRLALARVMLRKPHLLLLDEATSSLDPENEAVIMDVIKRLSQNVTVVFITHRMTLLPYFDKVIRL